MISLESIKNNIDKIISKKKVEPVAYLSKIIETIDTHIAQDIHCRPKDSNGNPGGLIFLKEDIPTIIIPDLHGRFNFLYRVLKFKIDELTVLEELYKGTIQIVCVGDGFHTERQNKNRWILSGFEYDSDFKTHENIDEEMLDNLKLMEIVFELKVNFPENFHFLKGNHENILNEEGDGNYPFGKFTSEGAIVKSWVEKFYGNNFLINFSKFEKILPIVTVGRNFIISHAEPATYYTSDEIINYHSNQDIIYDFTWTRNGDSEENVIKLMYYDYIDSEVVLNPYYFAGHTSLNTQYNLRESDNFVQFHNPEKYTYILIKVDREIDLKRDIGELNG